MNVRAACFAGNIIRDEAPVTFHSFSTTVEPSSDIFWDNGGGNVTWVDVTSHPALCARLIGQCVRAGWQPGVWPGSVQPLWFKLHRQPDNWGGHNNFVTHL